MGSGEVGGGGSVHWSITSKNPRAKARIMKLTASGNFVETGVDEGGKVGQKFTIAIRLPNGDTLDDFKTRLRKKGNRIEFTLPIAADNKQVHISWPDKGGKK